MTDAQPAPSRWLPIEERLPSPALLLLLKHPRSRPEIMAAMRAQGLRLTPEMLAAHIEARHVAFVGRGKFLMFCLPGREDEAHALRSKALAGGRAARDRNAEQADDAEQAQTTGQDQTTPQAAPTHQEPPKKREASADAREAAKPAHPAPKARPEPDALREMLASLGVQIAESVREARAVEDRRADLLMRARALEEVLGVMQAKMLRLVMARDRVQAVLDQSAPPPMCMDDFERIHLAPRAATKTPNAPMASDAAHGVASDVAGGATTSQEAPRQPSPAPTHEQAQTPAPDRAALTLHATAPAKTDPDKPKGEPPTPRREQPAQRSNVDCVELSREMMTPDGKKCSVTFTQSREGCTVLRPGVFVAWLDGHGHPNGEKIQGRLGELWDCFCADEPDALARIHAPTRARPR